VNDLDAEFAQLAAPAPTAAPAAAPQQSLDAEFAALGGSSGEPVAQGAPDYSLKGWGKFLANEGTRIGAQAIAGLPLEAMNLGVFGRNVVGNLYNKAVGNPATPDYELPGTIFYRMLDENTTPPTSMLGKATEFVGSSLLGGKLPTPQISNAAPAAFQNLASSAQNSLLTGAQQKALTAGKALGFRTQPGQETGNKVLQQIDAKLESQPWTSSPYHAIDTNNSRRMSQIAAKAIGEDAPAVDSTVLERANDRLGQVFENVRNPSRIVQQDPSVTANKVAGIDQELLGLLPKGTTVSAHPLVQQLLNTTQTGAINGQQLGQLSSKLGKSAYKEMTTSLGDRDLGHGLYQVKDHVDDLLQSTLDGGQAAEYSAARQQYRNLMLLARPGVVNPSTGEISGRTLANVLQRQDRNGFLFGKNQSDLYNAARFYQAFKPIVGNSGTATRSEAGMLPLLGTILGAAGGHAGGLGAVEGGGIGALAAPAALNMGSRAYVRGAAPAARAAAKVPGLLEPATKPALYGGLLTLQ